MKSRRIAAALAAMVCFTLVMAQPSASALHLEPGTKAIANSKCDLRPESFTKLHALVRPHEDEWRHLGVQWLTDVVAARRAAAEQDKPLVICYTGGAGYNEPLGVC